ncbi:MAG: hypothetical protein KDD66_02470 [Bdellovibrionales bacterium]|nr:hypothetical protein [Bdellovibrionales bacterium]
MRNVCSLGFAASAAAILQFQFVHGYGSAAMWVFALACFACAALSALFVLEVNEVRRGPAAAVLGSVGESLNPFAVRVGRWIGFEQVGSRIVSCLLMRSNPVPAAIFGLCCFGLLAMFMGITGKLSGNSQLSPLTGLAIVVLFVSALACLCMRSEHECISDRHHGWCGE